ncbi:MAG: hypothetical protein R3345_13965, partial [Fulvivirga sp.]|nr:hypothetical protein [Fulvivirga sp.]
MSINKQVTILLITMLLSGSVCAQVKYEKEYRIKTEDVPPKALNFIREIESGDNIRWYREESLNSASVEAKFKFNDRQYSIEFDTLGNLQDVEFNVSEKSLSKVLFKTISVGLDTLFDNWKFRKIQQHRAGPEEALLAYIKNQIEDDNLTILYEIVLKGKKEDAIELYQITFNAKGEVVEKLRIVQSDADNLE